MSLVDLDSEVLPIPCKCGHDLQERIGRLKTNPDLTCPKCGTVIHVDGEQLRIRIQHITDAFSQLERQIDSMRDTFKS